jgi:hypothetical protein
MRRARSSFRGIRARRTKERAERDPDFARVKDTPWFTS